MSIWFLIHLLDRLGYLKPAPAVNHCYLWANYYLHHPYPHCYANL